MLQTMRAGAASWVVKILFVVLIISFAAWGIGDVLRTPPNTTVARVGDVDISETQLINEFQRQVALLQQMVGPDFTAAEARQRGLVRDSLDRLVQQAAISAEVDRLGLTVSDEMLGKELVNNPQLRDPFGNFDKTQLQFMLRSQGMSEQEFLNRLRGDLATQQLSGTVSAGIAMPASVVERLYRHREERRVITWFVVRDAALPEGTMPTDEQVRAYYDGHQDDYRVPELRAVDVAWADPANLVGEVSVDDAQIEAAFEERRGEFGVPEKREVLQLIYPEKAAADAARARIVGGEDLLKVAKETTGAEAADVNLGLIGKDALPAPVADAAFALADQAVSEPVQSPFGWHLFKIARIEPGHEATLEEVRDRLRSDLALAAAADRLAATRSQAEDALASGGALDDTAHQLGWQFKRFTIDANGRERSGTAPADLPQAGDWLRQVFAANQDEHSDLLDSDAGGYLVFQVAEVIPAAVKPLDEVRTQVVEAWLAQERRRIAQDKANTLAEKARVGADMAALATEAGDAIVQTTSPITRDGAGGTGAALPEALLTALFKGPEGSTAAVAQPSENGVIVGRVAEVRAADPAANADQVASLKRELSDQLGQDLYTAFQQSVRASVPVNVDYARADRALGPSDARF
ncbi:peptidyl-prolyl cis-trans isomerase [Zavarzinia sp. CC-PAN008]|uniref:peptidylprolyl isomerase n=1 Tax=Zavarzinia sp. CC-PAN008 TaxID=3243332 RepID=UPI003F74801D